MTIKLAIASGYALLWVGNETLRRRAFAGRSGPLGARLEVLKPSPLTVSLYTSIFHFHQNIIIYIYGLV